MSVRAQWLRFALAASISTAASCRAATVSAPPIERLEPASAPILNPDAEALIASLLADDPSDFFRARARIWRIGSARWRASAAEFPGRPREAMRGNALDQPFEVVVVDEVGPRILLPLEDLNRGLRAPTWPALRIVAVLGAGDLVTGLRRELRPTPWLTLAAGIALTPIERESDHLRVRWSDPACGFELALTIDADDFGSTYEPGPSGRPSDEPESSDEAPALRLAPATSIYADADARELLVRLDPEPPSAAERLSTAARVRLIGAPVRKRQRIELRCRGVVIDGWVASADILEIPGRLAIVGAEAPPISGCGLVDAARVLVPRATPLYEPTTADADAEPTLIGVVAEDLELDAVVKNDGWSHACAPSPWGDLLFRFRLR
jgi:hypothetical protein